MKSAGSWPILIGLLVGCEAQDDRDRRYEPASTELTSVPNLEGRRFTAGDVVTWANLQDYLRDRTTPIVPGQADDKEVLGRLVMLQNASEVAEFVKEHRGFA